MTEPTPEQAAKVGRRLALDMRGADTEQRADLISDALIAAKHHGQITTGAAMDLGRYIDASGAELRRRADEIEHRLDTLAGPWPDDHPDRRTDDDIPDDIAAEIVARFLKETEGDDPA